MSKMRNRVIGSIFVVVAMLNCSPIMFAQDGQSGTAKGQGKASTPDLSGVWIRSEKRPKYSFAKAAPPLQPLGAYRFGYNSLKPSEAMNGKGRDELNPRYNCLPPGPTQLLFLHPFELIQSSRRLLIFYEDEQWHWVRQVWTDGRGHPEHLDPSWMGDSIGKWEGDTLVVDTIGLNDKTWIDEAGTPHTDALHMVERFRRVNHDTLEIEFSFDDPKIFTTPWTPKENFKLLPDGEIHQSYSCADKGKESY